MFVTRPIDSTFCEVALRFLVFLLLAATAFAQFAAEVHQHPTTAENARPRFQRLLAAMRFRRRLPGPEMRRKLGEIKQLLDEGRLTKAAGLIDAFVSDAQKRGDSSAAASPASAPFAAPSPGFASETPALLSTPEPSRPAASAGGGVLSLPAASVPEPARAAAAPPEAPASRPPPWRLIAALALVVAFVGAGLLLAARGAAARKPAAPAAPAAAPAKLTDKYALGRSIASGGMGEVYEGRDLALGRRVAIKRMLPDIKLDPGLRAQFVKEARTVAKLSHPYIVPIHECLESEGDLYLVFEFVEGETLDRLLARQARLPLKECRRILRYVCAAVDHAHKNHVLHRDLKPGNIMLDSGGIARVMDFGIALESTRTMTNSSPAFLDVSGTLRYMPPEQHYGKSVRASDVYALGVCVYEMATGHPPFAADSVDELIAAKRSRRYPQPSSLYAELPKEFDLFIAAVLAPDPQKRISSAPEFLELLEDIPA